MGLDGAGKGGAAVTQEEMAVKLAETESRSRSNARRLEHVEQRQEELGRLLSAVEVLSARQETLERDVKEIKSDVKTLSLKPGRRWESLAERAMYLAVGAAAAALTGGLIG